MPVIPSIAGASPLPKLPGPTLDRERRPTVDTRNVQAATEQLGRSTRTPELPMSLAENGLENIGQGVARVGNVVTAAAIQEQEATTRVQIHRADNALQTKLAEFDAWRADNPDPLTWQEKWNGMVTPMREQLLADKGLTGRAREEIALRSETFLARNTAEVTRVSRVAINGEAKKAILGNLRNAVASQDVTAFESYLAEGAKYLPDYEQKAIRREFAEEGERLQKKAKADAVEAAANGVTALAKTGGADVAIKNIRGGMFGKLDATDAENLENQARRVEATARGDIADSVLNGIISGEVKSSARIDELTASNPLVDEQTKAKLKGFLATKDDNAIAADREQNGVKNAVALRQMAKDYDPKKDPKGEQYLSMRWEVIQRVPEGLRNSVLDTLEAKADGKMVPIAPGIKGHIDSTLDRIFDPVHGAIKWRTTKVQETWEIDEKTGEKKKAPVFKEVPNDDATKRQNAIDRRSEIERELSPWLQANPQATPKQISEKIGELLPAGTRAQAAEALKGSAMNMDTKGTVTSYGYANDSTPDRNSSAGIGAFVPDKEQEKIKAGKPSDFKLREGDLAVSHDIEAEFRKAGVQPGESVMVKLANGETRMVRWMDRTANDSQLADINAARERRGLSPLKPLRGRFDFYSPSGKSPLDGVKVVGWSKPQSLFAGN